MPGAMSRVAWVPSLMPLQAQLLHMEQVSSQKRYAPPSPTLMQGGGWSTLRFGETPELLMNKVKPRIQALSSEVGQLLKSTSHKTMEGCTPWWAGCISALPRSLWLGGQVGGEEVWVPRSHTHYSQPGLPSGGGVCPSPFGAPDCG